MRTRATAAAAALLLLSLLPIALPAGPLAVAADSSAQPRDLDLLIGPAPTAHTDAGASSRYFWIAADGNDEGYAYLRFVLAGRTDRFRVWAEAGTQLATDPMVTVAEELEESLREGLLGTLWRATRARGLDTTPIDLVFAPFSSAGGYFSSADQPGSFSHPYSNRGNVIYVSEAACQLAVACDVSTARHELQHLLQYLIDPQEQAWLSEGLSEIAERGDASNAEAHSRLACADFPFLRWTDDGQMVGLYYAGAREFLRFWQSRHSPAALRAVAVSPLHGPDAFDFYATVHSLPGGFDDVFMDWEAEQAVFSLPDRPSSEARPVRGACTSRSTLSLAAGGTVEDEVSPYGCDRVVLEGTDALSLAFTGQATTRATVIDPHGGTSFWWSGRANQSRATLTRELDLTAVDRAHLTYWIWYDLEEYYDWGYVAVSTDGGTTWEVLSSTDTTTENPVGNCPGRGYTGDSEGWREQTVDLSPYAGKQVLLQFGYLTDDAVEYSGLAIDDLALPEIGLTDDMESGGSWVPLGFRLEVATEPLPQRYGARLVTADDDGYACEPLSVGDDGRAMWDLPAVGPGRQRVVVICGLTEAAGSAATYSLVASAN